MEKVKRQARAAVKAESEIIDWIIGDYKGERMSADILKEYVKSRVNDSMTQLGFGKMYEINPDAHRDFEWMNEEVLGNMTTDFFFKRPVEYSKKNRTFSAEELF